MTREELVDSIQDIEWDVFETKAARTFVYNRWMVIWAQATASASA